MAALVLIGREIFQGFSVKYTTKFSHWLMFGTRCSTSLHNT